MPDYKPLFAMIKSLGWDYETDVRDELQARYGVRSIRLLTATQVWDYKAHLQHLVDGRKTLREGSPLPVQGGGQGVGAVDHREPPPQPGYCLTYAQLLQIAQAQVIEGRVWRGEANEQDAELLAYVLNRCLIYRRRDGRLSLAQVHGIIGVCGRYPLWAFRRAVQIWAGNAKPNKENYFYGICRNVIRDQKASALPSGSGSLQLV